MTIVRAGSTLLIIDLQERLMPAIHAGKDVVGKARFLAEAARLLDIPTIFTEQNPAGLGGTVDACALYAPAPVAKLSFDACRDPAFSDRLPPDRHTIVAAGCEAHVCVLQTAFGLQRDYRVCVVADAVGSRRPENKAAALARLAARGIEIVTAEMVAFEWLASSDDPSFRPVIRLIKQL